jgi:hypothetical protein
LPCVTARQAAPRAGASRRAIFKAATHALRQAGGAADAAFSSEDGGSEAGTSASGAGRGEENGGAAPAPWSAAGAGVAAVSGRCAAAVPKAVQGAPLCAAVAGRPLVAPQASNWCLHAAVAVGQAARCSVWASADLDQGPVASA